MHVCGGEAFHIVATKQIYVEAREARERFTPRRTMARRSGVFRHGPASLWKRHFGLASACAGPAETGWSAGHGFVTWLNVDRLEYSVTGGSVPKPTSRAGVQHNGVGSARREPRGLRPRIAQPSRLRSGLGVWAPSLLRVSRSAGRRRPVARVALRRAVTWGRRKGSITGVLCQNDTPKAPGTRSTEALPGALQQQGACLEAEDCIEG